MLPISYTSKWRDFVYIGHKLGLRLSNNETFFLTSLPLLNVVQSTLLYETEILTKTVGIFWIENEFDEISVFYPR